MCWQNTQCSLWVSFKLGHSTQGKTASPPLCSGPCGQDDLLDLSVVFWNIPIDGVVGVIFLETPNMGRIPQTLKLSHPA